jgi:hypothetical protein
MLDQPSLIDLARAAAGTSARSIIPFNPPRCNCISDVACSSSASQQNQPQWQQQHQQQLSDLEFLLQTIDAVQELLGDDNIWENGK